MLPTGRRARCASVPPRLSPIWKGGPPCPTNQSRREVARSALPERRPLEGTPVTIACDRNWGSFQRSLAVVRRRPGPRHVLNPRGFSAPLRWLRVFVSSCLRWMALCPSLCLFGSAGVRAGLCGLRVFAVQKPGGRQIRNSKSVTGWCLGLFVVQYAFLVVTASPGVIRCISIS